MPSLKQLIVEKVQERLNTLEIIHPNFPETVPTFTNPFREVESNELPALKVAIMGGSANRRNNNIEYKNNDMLYIVYQVQGNDDADLQFTLYTAQEEITNFMILDDNDSGDPDSIHHLINDLEFIEWDMDLKNGESGTGAMVMKFKIDYHTNHNLIFDDLETVSIDLKHTDAGEDTESYSIDEQTLPTS